MASEVPNRELERQDAGIAGPLPPVDVNADAILLDIDGTLLDIAATPDAVRVPDGLGDVLTRLALRTSGALALVSGRTLESIDALFAPFGFGAIGCHGAQMRTTPQGEVKAVFPPLPAEVRAAFADLADCEPCVRMEDKTFALAFHYRLAPERREPLQALLRDRLARLDGDLVLMSGKSVFEIKPRTCTKGEALRRLIHLPPFAGRRPVFFGDDTTDEYAFAVLPEFRGEGISVGRPSRHARYMLASPHCVRRLLAQLAI